VNETGLIGGYLAELRQELRVGARLKSRIVCEVEAHLTESVEKEQASGAPPEEIERKVIERFGPPQMIVEQFVSDLATSAARTASGAVALALVGIAIVGSIVAGVSPSIPYELWPEPVKAIHDISDWASPGAFAATALALLLSFRHGGGGVTISRKDLWIVVPAAVFAFGATAISGATHTFFLFREASQRGELTFDSPSILSLAIGGTASALGLAISAVFVIRAVARFVALERAVRNNGGVESMSNAASQNLQNRSTLALIGTGLIFVAGQLHLALAPEHFKEALPLGLLFVADFVGAMVAAFGIYRGYRWAWMLGALVAGGAVVSYVVAGTVGLPGVGREHFGLFEPIGVITKAVEVLFLVISGFKLAGFLTGFRRWATVSGIAAMLVVPAGLAVAFGPLPGAQAGPGLPIKWKATSPAVHLGDQYSLVVKNTGEENQKTRVRSVIMDHSTHTNTPTIDKRVNLAPGEEQEFTAINDYGTANHFNTIIGSETQNLTLAVKVADATGAEKARFNQDAFLVQKGEAKG
jgi:hypothetical protein